MKINLEINLDLWIAREEDGTLYIFKNKPKKCISFWAIDSDYDYNGYGYAGMDIFQVAFPNLEEYFDFSQVQWEDSEPKRLRKILRK